MVAEKGKIVTPHEGSTRRVPDEMGAHQAVSPFQAGVNREGGRAGQLAATAGVVALCLAAVLVVAAGRDEMARTTALLGGRLVLPNGWLLVRVDGRVGQKQQHAQQQLLQEKQHERSAAKLLEAPAERVAKDKKRLAHDEKRLIALEALPDIVKDMPDPTASCHDKKGNNLRHEV